MRFGSENDEGPSAVTHVPSVVMRDEFSADEEPLAWDAEGWEDIG